MLHKSGQICQVGFNVSSTLQEHSISVLTKCRARLWIQVVPRKTFSPWANKPRAFFTIFRIVGAALQRSQQNQRSAILPPALANTQLRNLFVLCAFAGVVYILVPGNLRCSEKSHCLSAASLRFFWTLLADFQTLRSTRLRNRTPNK